MQIEITKEMIESLGIDKFKRFGLDDDWERWHGDATIHLEKESDENITYLKELLESISKIKKVKSRLYDMRVYIRSTTKSESMKVHRINHLKAVLVNYLKDLKHHWLFRTSEFDSNVKVAYYINDIEFHEKVKATRDNPGHAAHVTVELVYDKLGEGERTVITFYEGDIYGKTVMQLLLAKNLMPENEELIVKYDEEIKRYEEIFPLIGKQFTVSGTADSESSGYYTSTFTFSEDKSKNKVVVDVLNDEEGNKSRSAYGKSDPSGYFWERYGESQDSDEYDDQDEDSELVRPMAPIHPFIIIFDLFRHVRMVTHVTTLKEYVYDENLSEKLVLPENIKSLITLLIEHKESTFKDIVAGKGGGAIVLLTGLPGVGKTLTAEVFAEAEKKPLYSVQASQLGTDPVELEKNLMKILQRAKRWDAIMLLDESDVYVHTRGNDLIQNAIVGVFLRVLEYHASVLFLTTNRPDLVDDAIASRCVARIDYKYPNKEDQVKIWEILSEGSDITIAPEEINKFTEKNKEVSGRDIKNLLKLAMLITQNTKKPITCETLEYVLQFKPTNKEKKQEET